MLYAAIGAVAVAGALGVALMVQNARLDSAKAKLETCQAAYEQTLELVKKQNKAVSDLQEATKNAQNRARLASDAAAKARVANKSEIERLSALKPKLGACPAGQAVADVRKGLK